MQTTRRVARARRFQPRCGHGREDDDRDDGDTEQRRPPTGQSRGEDGPLGPGRRGTGGRGDDDAHRRRIRGSRYVYKTSTTRLTRTNVAASVKTAAWTTG